MDVFHKKQKLIIFWKFFEVLVAARTTGKKYIEHRIRKSCTWGYKHALVILGLKLGQFRNLGG
jgi:hypothetical protein